MASKHYVAECPKCGKVNKMISSYFTLDGGAHVLCSHCGKRYYASKPESPYRKTGDAIAYVKDKG